MREDYPTLGLNMIAWVSTVSQTDQIMRYVSLTLTILATLLSCAYTIYKWYKRANADGKIDKSEVNELMEDLTKELEKGKDSIDDQRKD